MEETPEPAIRGRAPGPSGAPLARAPLDKKNSKPQEGIVPSFFCWLFQFLGKNTSDVYCIFPGNLPNYSEKSYDVFLYPTVRFWLPAQNRIVPGFMILDECEDFFMDCLISQKMRTLAPELDPLRIGTGWKPEDLSKPQILIESTAGDSHTGRGHMS